METIEPGIETTADGSQTLRHPLLHDTYHSVRGAEGESRYVFIEQGLCALLRHRAQLRSPAGVQSSPVDGVVRILEVGFGSGLNAWLTCREALRQGLQVYYETLELYPVCEQLALQLAYASDESFGALHRAPWEVEARLNEAFTLKKRCCSLVDCRFDATFDLVYFDAFAPDTQPELWSREVFSRIYDSLAPGGLLVTYSAKGMVKENLRSAGFFVKRLPGALGKRHMLRAEKQVESV